MTIRSQRWRTEHVWWSPDKLIVTCGELDGLPAIPWGWADSTVVATRRQLRAAGLRPGGQDPVAVLAFQHAQPNRRRIEHAALFLIERACPKREATPAQLRAVDQALRARRTCELCGTEQDHYLSTTSRLCGPCEDLTEFWPRRAAEHGWGWAA